MKKFVLSVLGLAAMVTAQATTAPVTFAIDSEEAASQWTVIDANNDGDPYLWVYNEDATYGSNFLYTENRSKKADDWAITPSVEMEAGNTYVIKVWFRNASTYSSDKQDFTVTAGKGVTVDDQTATVFSKSSIKDKSWTAYEGTFIPATSGEYNIGFHLTSASYMGNCGLQKIEVTVKTPLPGAVSDLSINAGENGALQAVLTWTNPSVTDGGAALTNFTGVKIYRSTSSTVSATESNLVATVSEGMNIGEAATYVDTTVPESGLYYYKVVPYCDGGDSPVYTSSVKSAWIGEDTPNNATNVVASVVEGEDAAVSLTWDYELTGKNGGYVDPAKLAWKIVRKNSASAATTIEEAWQGDLPYIDRTIPGLDSYTYTVYYVYDGTSAWSGATSNSVGAGGAMALPYTEDFSSSNALNLFTTLVGPEGTRTWGLSSGKVSFWQSPYQGDADAWLITPAFELEKGKAYELSFSTWRQTDNKDLYVTIGTAPTIDAQNIELWHETVSWGTMTTNTVYVSVEETGRYNIGFHCYGNTTSNDIYLDNLSLKETVFVPQAATEFTATAASEGALKVELAWVNPTKTNADTELTTLSKVEVYRGSELIATLEDCVPGMAASYTDVAIEQAGVYTYRLVPYCGEYAGEAVTATSSFVGVDTPAAPINVVAALNGDGIPVITFTAPTEGVNGGYIDTDAMTFTVVRMPDGKVVAENTTETTVTDEPTDALASYTYEVTAAIGNVVSAKAVSNSIVMGDAFSLPYKPDMASASTFDLWTLPENSDGNKWNFDSSSKALRAYYSDMWAFTAPFKAQEGKITLKMKATCYNYRYQEDLQIGLYSEASPEAAAIGDVKTQHIESVSYPSEMSFEFDVPEDGTYYIGYYMEDTNWALYLSQSNVEQTVVAEKITVYWNNTDAQYAIPAVVAGDKEIVMTCLTDKKSAPSYAEENTTLMKHNVYYAEISSTATSITFKDGAEGSEAEPVDVKNPQHNYLYSPDGAVEFDDVIITGIDKLTADYADAIFYDLHGMRVKNPVAGRMYIMVRDGKATKIVVR